MTCPTCGADPCINSSFCATCRKIDARRARQPHRNGRLPDDWQDISIDALVARLARARPTPESTVDALMFSLRARGTSALEEPATRRRLAALSDQQAVEVGTRLLTLASPWSEAEVLTLMRTREALK